MRTLPLLVWYTGEAPPAPAHSADGNTVYQFHGGSKQMVSHPEDVAKFKHRAAKNPDTWHCEETGAVGIVKKVRASMSLKPEE